MTTNANPTIPERSDAGETPATIALATGTAVGKVYAILRRERPLRKRAARRRSSAVPTRVVALAACGLRAGRIAELCCVSKAYVYRILAEEST